MRTMHRGFTLIELLVVIAIIGILAAVILASLGAARDRARAAKRMSDIKQIETALNLYFSNNGTYPVGGGYLPPHADNRLAELVTAGLMPSLPADPYGGNIYYYSTNYSQGFMLRYYVPTPVGKYCIYATSFSYIAVAWQGYINDGTYIYCKDATK